MRKDTVIRVALVASQREIETKILISSVTVITETLISMNTARATVDCMSLKLWLKANKNLPLFLIAENEKSLKKILIKLSSPRSPILFGDARCVATSVPVKILPRSVPFVRQAKTALNDFSNRCET